MDDKSNSRDPPPDFPEQDGPELTPPTSWTPPQEYDAAISEAVTPWDDNDFMCQFVSDPEKQRQVFGVTIDDLLFGTTGRLYPEQAPAVENSDASNERLPSVQPGNGKSKGRVEESQIAGLKDKSVQSQATNYQLVRSASASTKNEHSPRSGPSKEGFSGKFLKSPSPVSQAQPSRRTGESPTSK